MDNLYYVIDLSQRDADPLLKLAHTEYRRFGGHFMPQFNVDFSKALIQVKLAFNRGTFPNSAVILQSLDEFGANDLVTNTTEWNTAVPPDRSLVLNYLNGSGTLAALLTTLKGG